MNSASSFSWLCVSELKPIFSLNGQQTYKGPNFLFPCSVSYKEIVRQRIKPLPKPKTHTLHYLVFLFLILQCYFLDSTWRGYLTQRKSNIHWCQVHTLPTSNRIKRKTKAALHLPSLLAHRPKNSLGCSSAVLHRWLASSQEGTTKKIIHPGTLIPLAWGSTDGWRSWNMTCLRATLNDFREDLCHAASSF